MKVFLGGTCNNSTWREELIPQLEIDYFNPVVEDWTPECMQEELRQRDSCDFCLYIISPEMTGVYSIAEAVDDSNKRPDSTIFVINDIDVFSTHQLKSLRATAKMIRENGGETFENLKDTAEFLNSYVPF